MSSPTIARAITTIMGRLKTLKTNIKIKDCVKTESVLRHMIENKTTSLQAVFDFDRTLTRPHKDGIDLGYPSTIPWTNPRTIILSSNLVSIGYVIQAEELSNKYLPIELDIVLSNDEKVPSQVEWYKKQRECHCS